MSRPQRIHHINFLFADPDAAARRFSVLLGNSEFIREDLVERGVRTARARVGEPWLLSVSPVEPQAHTVPATHMRKHGEGFFLLSFGVADLDQALNSLNAESSDREALDG